MSRSRFISTAGPDAPDSVRFVGSTKTFEEALRRKRELDVYGSPYTLTHIFQTYIPPPASSPAAPRFVVDLLHVEADETEPPPPPSGAKPVGFDLFAVPMALAANWSEVCRQVQFVVQEFSLERPPGSAE